MHRKAENILRPCTNLVEGVRAIVVLFFILSIVQLPVLGATPTNCQIDTFEAMAIGDLYVRESGATRVEVWQESNDVPGLQRFLSGCDGAATIPRDTCIKHTENNAFIACLVTFPSSL